MTHKIFFISDTHFGHKNILGFKRNDGTPLREFADVEEMHEIMIERWNSVVRPQDKVYHLGDVAIGKDCILPIFRRLNGHKRLVRGNHDIYADKVYRQVFEAIHGVRVFHKEGLVLSHVPLHPDSLARKAWGLNVHGHLHSNVVLTPDRKGADDRYLNVSVEQINYTPISLQEILEIKKERGIMHDTK